MLAVGREVLYAILEDDTVIALDAMRRYRNEIGGLEVKLVKPGRVFEGLSYTPMFPYFADLTGKTGGGKGKKSKGAFRVIHGDFVSADEGTGIVHLAPGFGEDDFNACRAYNPEFPVVVPVDERGRFEPVIKEWAGMQVFDANEGIASVLKERGLVLKKDQIVHQYPHCWRTDKPLIYRAQSGWYVKVTAVRERMVELNQNVRWMPEHVRDGRFGKWLENARDWSISRNRFWGAPIPVWKSDSAEYPFMEVLGSAAEIEARAGSVVADLHRPYVDVEYPNPKDPTGKSRMVRVRDVFDCWFESGSMPFASAESFGEVPAADFISEGLDQTRGWFYTLAVLGVALFDKIPYKTVVCTGLVFDEKGQKLSKKLGNYSEPTEFLDKFGSDALRWFFLGSSVLKGGNVGISKDGDEILHTARNSTIPLYNAYHFFTLYANADGVKALRVQNGSEEAMGVMDRHILSLRSKLVSDMRRHMDNYENAAALAAAEKFLDLLNNWYIRLNRERFWGTSCDAEDRQAAFDTLYTVLTDVCLALAPVMPFLTDYIYTRLTGEDSAHLADYPCQGFVDAGLLADMDLVQQACSAAKVLREEKGIKNRQPLVSLLIVTERPIEDYAGIIALESNVKKVEFARNLSDYAEKSLYLVTPVLGAKYGGRLPEIIRAAKAGDYTVGNGICAIAGVELVEGEFEEKLSVRTGMFGKATGDMTSVVILDAEITPELEVEGRVRDFIREVQELRKIAGLNVSDRIRLSHNIDIPSEWVDEVARVALVAEFVRSDKLEVEAVGAKEARK